MFPELELKEGWVTVICLLLVVLCVAWAIQAAEWAQDLSVVQGTALVGGLLGILLAKSRFPNRTAHLLSLLAGWTWAAYLTSRALAERGGLPFLVGVYELERRLGELFHLASSPGGSADNYVFVLLLALLIWIMAYFGAWAVFRWQQVWWAIIVCGAALIINTNYSMENLTVYLIMFLLFALLLVVRSNVAFRVQEWRQAHVGYSQELVSTVLQAGLILSIVVILLAWAAPEALASRPLQPFLDKIGEPWRRMQERSAEIFQDLNYQNPAPLISMGDRRMWFGGPVSLTDTPIADVQARTGRYWRVMVFHEYAGNGWLSTDEDTILLGENERTLAFPELLQREELTQTISVHHEWTSNDALIAAGQPLLASLPMRASVSMVTNVEQMVRSQEGTLFPPAPGDPSVLYSRQNLGLDDTYNVLSSVSVADETSLREAGTIYPDWVVPRYLQLPDSLPERVHRLAEELTEGLDNKYDETKAIETYLRQLPYNLDIPGPRLGQDGVDYFLFDEQQGYCDYYASAMVVMLRSIGVPARYVRGYIQPGSDEGIYRLLESDGHAWPEVYFPGYGWIEFEPTGGRPALVRRASPDPASARDPLRPAPPPDRAWPQMDDGGSMLPPEREAAAQAGIPWAKVRLWAIAAMALALPALALYLWWQARRRRRHQHLSPAEVVYDDLVFWVRRLLRIAPLAHQTPHEYAVVVVQNLPDGRGPVERIVSSYVEERFSGHQVTAEDAGPIWREAWQALWIRWVEKRFDSFRGPWWRFFPPKRWEADES
jgi:transglutaminase-like putative cysteine protease